MSARTAFLSKLIGLYCILITLAMASHREQTLDTVSALLHSAPWLLILGVMAVAAGLAMVLSHNVWSGGAATVLVTIIGWGALTKGALFLFLTPEAESAVFFGWLHYAELFYGYVACLFLLGIYLTYAGSRPAVR